MITTDKCTKNVYEMNKKVKQLGITNSERMSIIHDETLRLYISLFATWADKKTKQINKSKQCVQSKQGAKAK